MPSVSFSLANEGGWSSQEIYSGSHVNSATAHDFNGDGTKEILFSAEGKFFMYSGPDYGKSFVFASATPKYAKMKPRCIHCVLHDVDEDGDLDFVGSYVCEIFWLECPDDSPTSTQWKMHLITDQIFGVHCIRSFDIDQDGTKDLITNDFTDDKGPYSGSVCWLKPKFHESNRIGWSIVPLAKGTAQGGSHYFDFGDINGDGRIDFAMGAKGKPFENGNYFAVYYSQKDIAQPWRKEFLPGAGQQFGATHAAPADVNGDGKIDILASRGHGIGVLWFEAPDWKQHMIDNTIDGSHSTDFADIDGDGDIDMSTVGCKSSLAVWYENDGKGNFTRHILSSNQMAYDTMITDLNGDGSNDILVAGQRSKNVIWFKNPSN